jgi:hypothetical protein
LHLSVFLQFHREGAVLRKIPQRDFAQHGHWAEFLAVLPKFSRSALLRKILHRDFAQYVKIEGRCLWVGAQCEWAG